MNSKIKKISITNSKEEMAPRREITIHKGQQTQKKDEGIIEVIATTELPVKRYYYDWDDHEFKLYMESLICTKESIQSNYLDSGALKLFKNHWTGDVDEIVGKCIGWKTEEGKLLLSIKMERETEIGEEFYEKVKNGFITSFSVGYKIDYEESVMEERDGVDWLLAKSWTPYEVSAVGVPADHSAQLLKIKNLFLHNDKMESNIKLIKEALVDKKDIKTEKTDKEEDKTVKIKEKSDSSVEKKVLENYEKADALAKRTTEMFDLGKRYNLDSGKIQDFIFSKKDISEIKLDLLMDKIESEKNKKPETPDISVGIDNKRDGLRKFAIAEMKTVLFGAKKEKIEGFKRNDFDRQDSFVGIMKDFLSSSGKVVPTTNHDCVRSAMATTDFALLLADTVHRQLYDIFKNAYMKSHGPLVEEMMIADYREKSVATIGTGRSAIKITEHGSISYEGVTESGQKIQVNRYADGRIISHEMMVNDDVQLIRKIMESVPITLGLTDSALFWDEYNNGTLSDTNKFFHSTINAPAAVQTLTNVGLGMAYAYLKTRQAGASAKKVTGRNKPLYLQLGINTLVVPPAMAPTAKSLVRDIMADTAANVNIFADEIKDIIISPYMAANKWSAHANNMAMPSFYRPLLQIFR